MGEQSAGLTPLGKVLSFLIIIALIGAGGYVVYQKQLAPKPAPVASRTPTAGAAGESAGSASDAGPAAAEGSGLEAPDTRSLTTVKDYKYIPQERLPEVKGASAYKWDPEKRFSASATTSGQAGCRSSPPTTVPRRMTRASSTRSTASAWRWC